MKRTHDGMPGPREFLSAIAILLSIANHSAASVKPSAAEQLLFNSVNRERAANQLAALHWDSALAEAAQQHAQLMAAQHRFAHQLPGEPSLSERAGLAGARFARVAENIAMGADAEEIHDGWMHSPGHRANILDAHFTALGVGVIEHEGSIYAVEDFSVAVASLGLKAQEEKVTALLSTTGLHVLSERELARRACMDPRDGRAERPTLIFRYEVSDLSELPEALTRKIREHAYHKAEVGACAPEENAVGFARFRIAVVLF